MKREINPKYFHAFLAVVESQSFSAAASKAYMTQANISKHIQALEEQVGEALFIRTNKSPVITEAGKCLLEYIKKLEQLNSELYQKINRKQESMCGVVKYSMLHPRMMYSSLSKLREHWHLLKDVEMDVFIDSQDRIINNVLDGTIDFGFVETHYENAKLRYLPFGHEEYVLVGMDKDELAAIKNAEDLLGRNFIQYPGMQEYFDGWFSFHFQNAIEVNSSSLNYSGKTNNIDSAILMLREKRGISVFPRNYVDEYLKDGRLNEWQQGVNRPYFKDVYLVSLVEQDVSRRVGIVIDFFVKALKAGMAEAA